MGSPGPRDFLLQETDANQPAYARPRSDRAIPPLMAFAVVNVRRVARGLAALPAGLDSFVAALQNCARRDAATSKRL